MWELRKRPRRFEGFSCPITWLGVGVGIARREGCCTWVCQAGVGAAPCSNAHVEPGRGDLGMSIVSPLVIVKKYFEPGGK